MSRFTLAHYLSFGSFTVAFIVLFFGNNLLDRLRGPNVRYSGFAVELKYPNAVKTLEEYGKPFANYYREIDIRNLGNKASTNLSLTIEVDGRIVDKEIKSDESYGCKVDSSTVILDFKRFVQGATATCKLWLIKENSDFKIHLIDDGGIKNDIEIASSDSMTSLLLIIIGALLLIVSVSLFGYAKYVRPRTQEVSRLEATNVDLEATINKLQSELSEMNDTDNLGIGFDSYNKAMEELNLLLDKYSQKP